jgi:hypothetical protein
MVKKCHVKVDIARSVPAVWWCRSSSELGLEISPTARDMLREEPGHSNMSKIIKQRCFISANGVGAFEMFSLVWLSIELISSYCI